MTTPEPADALLNHIRKFIALSDDEATFLLDHVQFKTLRNKDFLLKAGDVCHENFFIVQGCVRMYMHIDNGTEQIIQFAIDNWWMTDYMSFDHQKPAQFNIQAVEPTQVVVFSRSAQDVVFEKIPRLERYFRIILQRAYSASLMRIHFIYNQTGEARYQQFTRLFPDFVQRVPQYMLASYLGFTPEFLSKIRAKKG
ncbi:Crp/Fnr family transcriptional regulator [Chryseolinea lacunae]|uniref:Crp/Fnr family transcriptional regulator n=1 Tax=Chryseolinea lacunae TaxID=2801331 RepID=A0ABS1KWQ1_9BACT|nr:Crp/Fnr family transcriptional regulator [Chryseolinea lacunae]MBL0743880.1 Crp/Fnr family transcriptional regulator [Chryseolinea lacunae]